MGETLRRIRRGVRGHPGTIPLLALVGMGWVAAGTWWGAVVMLGIFGPPYLVGAWGRGRCTAIEEADDE